MGQIVQVICYQPGKIRQYNSFMFSTAPAIYASNCIFEGIHYSQFHKLYISTDPAFFVSLVGWLLSCSTFYSVAGKKIKKQKASCQSQTKVCKFVPKRFHNILGEVWKQNFSSKSFNILVSRLTLNWEVPKYF